MSEDERKRRNYVIAGSVGAFLLPLAGVVGAMVFFSRDDRDAAWWLIGGAIVGVVAYLFLFGVV